MCSVDSNDSRNIDILDILAVLRAYNIEFDTSACVPTSSIVDTLYGIVQRDGIVQRLDSLQTDVTALKASAAGPAAGATDLTALQNQVTQGATDLAALQTQDDEEGHFVCVSGWTSDSGCTVDGQSARLQCEDTANRGSSRSRRLASKARTR